MKKGRQDRIAETLTYIPKTQDIYIQRAGYICPIHWRYIPNKLDVYNPLIYMM